MGVVCDYCLKPIARDKLTALLGKLHLILEEQKEKQQEKKRSPDGKSGISGVADLYARTFQEKLVVLEALASSST